MIVEDVTRFVSSYIIYNFGYINPRFIGLFVQKQRNKIVLG